MIAQRILYPSSKLAATRLWETTTLAESWVWAATDVDELYAALDWLLQRQKRIENKLAKRHLSEARGALRRQQQFLLRTYVSPGAPRRITVMAVAICPASSTAC
jgi:hypothetical protein